MIKKLINGYEHFECSNCGEETYEDADYCQICGHIFNRVFNHYELENTAQDGETICIVIGATKSNEFTFTQLKIDMTPKILFKLASFQNQRMMKEANPYEFYVFKTNKYPDLSQGTQINLNFENYEDFKTSNGFRIYYDKTHFSNYDIIELKTYNFKV